MVTEWADITTPDGREARLLRLGPDRALRIAPAPGDPTHVEIFATNSAEEVVTVAITAADDADAIGDELKKAAAKARGDETPAAST